jgi:hypothetical protein
VQHLPSSDHISFTVTSEQEILQNKVLLVC